MRRSSVSLLPVIWIVIGLVVAATHHFFDHITTIGGILSAILAVILWPLILLGVKIAIAI
jgi:ABC-type anion transport system duplicated permease subunit